MPPVRLLQRWLWEFEQWAKYLSNIDTKDVKKFERYVRGEF